MTRNSLRTTIGLFFVLSHFLILLIVLSSPLYGVSSMHAFEMATVVAPLFAAFSTAIIKHFIKHANSTVDRGVRLSTGYVTISFFIPSMFVLNVVGVFLAYALDVINISFEQAKIMIGTLEILFGIYIGLIVESLFGRSH